jgi:hypothetical protein
LPVRKGLMVALIVVGLIPACATKATWRPLPDGGEEITAKGFMRDVEAQFSNGARIITKGDAKIESVSAITIAVPTPLSAVAAPTVTE